jgi:hypothetical protein
MTGTSCFAMLAALRGKRIHSPGSVLSPKYEVFCCDQNGPPALPQSCRVNKSLLSKKAERDLGSWPKAPPRTRPGGTPRIPPRDQIPKRSFFKADAVLLFILLCDSTHEHPKSLLDFAHHQRLTIFVGKNTVNMKRRECISHRPSLISIVPPGHTGTATALNAEIEREAK